MDDQRDLNHIVGLFELHQQAQVAVEKLLAAGFDKDHVSILANIELTHSEAATRSKDKSVRTGLAEGLSWGGLTGAALGLFLLASPGILVSGPLALAIGVSAAGVGAIGGGIIGAMNELGIPDEHANMYYEAVQRGGVVVSVFATEEKTSLVSQLMTDAGALKVNEHSPGPSRPGWQKVYSAADPDAEPPLPGDQIV